ncbi:FMN-binding protein [Streptomyces sp. LRE541]|uniref:FMN-binding protein n=1 Tax=Streptomyces sp. LRE541 TaxID=2931983 RepID=UPI0020108A70|nr:FMN-binding protein [Streptomyces sp. LRE541]UPZ32365.1 FMN-binding protein [Streptomyces sp. LRE541]
MKKSHPLRRIVLAGAATVSGIVLLLSLKPASDPAAASADGAAQQQQPAAPQGSGGVQAAGGTEAQTLTGDVVKTDYGNVQVRITVAGGKITSAAALQSPTGGRSTQVSTDAVPKLNRAAVTAGTADIDAVSGATYTSGGYKKSLQSALDKAGAAGAAGATGGGSAEASGTGGGTGGTGGDASGSGSGAGAAQAKTVTGKAVTTDYGPVQVRVTVAGGKITKAEAVQQPKGGRSDQISADAVPKLNAAAVAAGNADIDAVSGATYTSGGYKESLQSALDQAGG